MKAPHRPPSRPPLTRDGCYSKPELYDYIRTCAKEKIPFFYIARDLGVSIDRIAYVMSEGGFSVIFREQLRGND